MAKKNGEQERIESRKEWRTGKNREQEGDAAG